VVLTALYVHCIDSSAGVEDFKPLTHVGQVGCWHGSTGLIWECCCFPMMDFMGQCAQLELDKSGICWKHNPFGMNANQIHFKFHCLL